MLQFASDLYLEKCMGLRKLIAYNTFNGLKLLHIMDCSCSFVPVEGGSGQFDPLPNLEYIELRFVENLKSVSDFGQYWGLRFSKLRQLAIYRCESLTCLFKDGGAFSVPKHMEEITRVRKLKLFLLPELGTLGEPQSMWEDLEELKSSSPECGTAKYVGGNELSMGIQNLFAEGNMSDSEGSSSHVDMQISG
ncbi:hypothetical protein CQW23_18389 [Capsicum baccatum]|uniref:NB-ARC domain-containing protein n=1 Tax=Capsicum baccatum TaxID=33114 RepID=A0A2G2W2T6_CAPBA|nr:hypothetical protein CQW23_18389 [Capsicum baccatum]